jgi:hypothetical protein
MGKSPISVILALFNAKVSAHPHPVATMARSVFRQKPIKNRSKPVKRRWATGSPETGSTAPKWRAGQGLSKFSDPQVNCPERTQNWGYPLEAAASEPLRQTKLRLKTYGANCQRPAARRSWTLSSRTQAGPLEERSLTHALESRRSDRGLIATFAPAHKVLTGECSGVRHPLSG